MSAALVPLPGPLSMETADGPWCIVRYLEGRMCGPISVLTGNDSPAAGGYGFPERGGIGVVVWFQTEAEAREFFGNSAPKWVEHRATARSELHFYAEEHNHYDGSTRVLYDDGDYRMARAAVWLRRGEVSGTEHNPGYHTISLKCRIAGADQR